MPPFHVVLDQPKSWLDYVQFITSCVTALAAIATVLIAARIARNQNKLQETIARNQLELQKTLAEQQANLQKIQLIQNLFDRRFAVFTAVEDFIVFVIQSEGAIEFTGPGEYRNWWETTQKAQMLFGKDVMDYLESLDKAAWDLHKALLALKKDQTDTKANHDHSRLQTELANSIRQQRVKIFGPYLDLSLKG